MWRLIRQLDLWGAPPNFLLVDYYNFGSFHGSVLQVAATMNHVTYNGHCCGTSNSRASRLAFREGTLIMGTLLEAALVSMVVMSV